MGKEQNKRGRGKENAIHSLVKAQNSSIRKKLYKLILNIHVEIAILMKRTESPLFPSNPGLWYHGREAPKSDFLVVTRSLSRVSKQV